MNDQESTSSAPSTGTALLLRPVEAAASAVRRVPGAGTVGGMVDGVLDTVGLVSPRARRIAAYTGAGLLGALGAVEWPVAAVGAAAVWLTQARPKSPAGATPSPTRAGKPGAKTRLSKPAKPAKAAKAVKAAKPSKPKAESTGGTARTSRASKASPPGSKAPSRRRTTAAASAGSARRKTAAAADRG
ncbi:hypothetical protein ACIG5E_18675 [Kitasatospora sp. NPDC053057]|uniref:hypothetical protein n=1 Tax=Kitasatospora sp. NPDC053057 TaxID=3364062 RepID=UPI0037C980A2